MNPIAGRRTPELCAVILISGLISGLALAQAPAAPAGATSPAASIPAAQTPQSPDPPTKVVLKVGDQQYTKGDLDFLVENLPPQAQRKLATEGRKQLGDQFALVVMLSQLAHSHHLDQTPTFEHKLAVQKQQMEAQAAYDEIVQQVKVSPEEISQYYSTHANDFDELVMRQFVVRKRAGNTQAGPGIAPEQAKERAEAIRKEVAAGTDMKKVQEDFKAPGDVIIEPEPRTFKRGNLPPDMEKATFGLKEGEISEVFDLPQAAAFFQVTKHSHAEVKDVSAQIEEILRKQKTDAALEELKKKTSVWMDDQYFGAPTPRAGGGPAEPLAKKPEKP